MKNINPKDFIELRKKSQILIIDIREYDEVEQDPFTSTVNIPSSHLITRFNDLLKKDETYYIICHLGQRSALVTNILDSKGYNVINVVGGVATVNHLDRSN